MSSESLRKTSRFEDLRCPDHEIRDDLHMLHARHSCEGRHSCLVFCSFVQVCACESGRLFAADASQVCGASGEFCEKTGATDPAGAAMSAILIN